MRIMSLIQERKTLIVMAAASLFIILSGIYFYLYTIPEESILTTPPALKEVSNEQVRIVWETEAPVTAALYLSDGEGEQAVTEDEPGKYHEIALRGLEPETVYEYRLSSVDSRFYTFKTAPSAETPFRFLLFDRDEFLQSPWVDRFIETANTQIPDFAVAGGRVEPGDYQDKERSFIRSLAENTPGLPVYLIAGSEGADFYFDFGNSRFIILGSEARAAASLANRLNWLEGVVKSSPSRLKHKFVISKESAPGQEAADGHELERYLNSLLNTGELAAVFNLNGDEEKPSGGGNVDGKAFKIRGTFMAIDVDGEGITGQMGSFMSPELTDVVIKDFPAAVKRSCVYCRKLIEKEKYQESIQWYRDFIADFGDEYLVDDSQFEIANIYDRYLYDYKKAIEEYRKLITNYPDSGKIRQAIQRIEYLERHSDHEFEPLRIFERAKMESFEEGAAEAAAEVEAILTRYPGSSLEPRLLDWLGRTLAELDFEKSRAYLERLAVGEYGKEYQEGALIALGDTLYANRQYEEAIEVFKRGETEANRSALAGKLYRCRRNINREMLKLLAVMICAVLAGTAVFARPLLFKRSELKLTGILALIYLTAGLLIWKLLYTDYPGLLQYILALSAAGAVVPLIVSAVSRRLFKSLVPGCSRLLTGLLSLLLSLSVIYLAIYFYRVHYLVAFRL